jgi:hypothetical protein
MYPHEAIVLSDNLSLQFRFLLVDAVQWEWPTAGWETVGFLIVWETNGVA